MSADLPNLKLWGHPATELELARHKAIRNSIPAWWVTKPMNMVRLATIRANLRFKGERG